MCCEYLIIHNNDFNIGEFFNNMKCGENKEIKEFLENRYKI